MGETTRSGTMAGRAAAVIALLVGFYLLAAGIIAALLWANLAMWQAGRLNLRLALVTIVIAIAIVRGVFFVATKFDGIPAGIRVTRADEPKLHALIDEVAAAAGTEPPDEVWLVHDVNAFVLEETRLGGLIRTRRVMAIGMALLHALTVEELRAVLAHEYGHYVGGDTALGGLVYRTHASIARTAHELGGGWLTAVFVAYGKLYLRVSRAVSRRQELDADALAARIAGSDTHRHALRIVHGTGDAYAWFLEEYVRPAWVSGRHPIDLYGGFTALISDPAQQAQIEAATAAHEHAAPDPYDTHPSLSARLAHLDALPVTATTADRRPAVDVLADRAARSAEFSELLAGLVIGHETVPIEWEDMPDHVYAAREAHHANQMLLAAQQVARRRLDVEELIALAASERRPELARELVQRLTHDGVAVDGEDPDRVLQRYLRSAVGAALVEVDGMRWQMAWSGALGLVSRDGAPVDLDALLAPATHPPA